MGWLESAWQNSVETVLPDTTVETVVRLVQHLLMICKHMDIFPPLTTECTCEIQNTTGQ